MRVTSHPSPIALYQRDIRKPLPHKNELEYQKLSANLSLVSTLILPEYFAFHQGLNSIQECLKYSQDALEWLQDLSLAHPRILIIGGSVLEVDYTSGKWYNTCFVFFQGKCLAKYRKRKLYKREKLFLAKGEQSLIISHPVTKDKWGILLCADVFLKRWFEKTATTDYIAIPTASSFRLQDTPLSQTSRDYKIFFKKAVTYKTSLLKCCCVGNIGLVKRPYMRFMQGRSLVVSPQSILGVAPNIYWAGMMIYYPEKSDIKLVSF